MKYKRISFGQGKGSITHNNRTFIANNVDRNRIADNVTFISKSIGEVYEELFGEAVERYNARQKRNDRKIHGIYYEHLFHCKPSTYTPLCFFYFPSLMNLLSLQVGLFQFRGNSYITLI